MTNFPDGWIIDLECDSVEVREDSVADETGAPDAGMPSPS